MVTSEVRRPRKRRRRQFTGVLRAISGRIAANGIEEIALAELEVGQVRGGEGGVLLVLRGGLLGLLASLRVGKTYVFLDFDRKVALQDDFGYRRDCHSTSDFSSVVETEPADALALPEDPLVPHLVSPPSEVVKDLLLATPFVVQGRLASTSPLGWMDLLDVTVRREASASTLRLERCRVFFPHYHPSDLVSSCREVTVHHVLPLYLWERQLEGFYTTIRSSTNQLGQAEEISPERILVRVPSCISQRCSLFTAWVSRSLTSLSTCLNGALNGATLTNPDDIVMTILKFVDAKHSELFTLTRHSYLAEFVDLNFSEVHIGNPSCMFKIFSMVI